MTAGGVLIRPDASSSLGDTIAVSAAATNLTPGQVSAVMPFVLRADQLYYWTYAWQDGEIESQADIDRGDTVTFSDADSAIRWLLTDDE